MSLFSGVPESITNSSVLTDARCMFSIDMLASLLKGMLPLCMSLRGSCVPCESTVAGKALCVRLVCVAAP